MNVLRSKLLLFFKELYVRLPSCIFSDVYMILCCTCLLVILSDNLLTSFFHYEVFKVPKSFYRSFAARILSPTNILYSITLSGSCQWLFKNFFKIFFQPFELTVQVTAFIYYHLVNVLSTYFLQKFLFFFNDPECLIFSHFPIIIKAFLIRDLQ